MGGAAVELVLQFSAQLDDFGAFAFVFGQRFEDVADRSAPCRPRLRGVRSIRFASSILSSGLTGESRITAVPALIASLC